MMYRKKASRIVNLTYHTVEFEGRTYTEEEAIDRIIDWTGYFLKHEWEYDDDAMDALQRAIRLWAEVLPYVWW